MKVLNITKAMSEKEVTKLVKDEKVSKSQKIRDLFNAGMEINQIKDLLGVRYNFCYNVLRDYVNMNGIEVVHEERTSRKTEIVELIRSGKSLADVSRETKCQYNYIWKIAKEAGLTKKEQEVTVKEAM